MTLVQNQQDFDKELSSLQREFEKAEHLNESDEEIGNALLNYILQSERLRRGVAHDAGQSDAVDLETIDAMQSWDSDDPLLSTVQKVLNRLSAGRLTDATLLLKAVIAAKKTEISARQSANASHPRKKNPVTSLIEDIVTNNPHITAPGLENKLRNQIGNGVISNMDKETIDPEDMDYRSVKISGLKDHLSRIKKILSQ